jgi:hypothetical protein
MSQLVVCRPTVSLNRTIHFEGKKMSDVCRYKFLVIDNQDLLETNNLVRKVNQAEKHPEPVLTLDAPWDRQSTDSIDYINVIYDQHEQLFKMWYAVTGISPDTYWERGRKTAYATSQDGIHWEKPIMNCVEVNGSRENNYIIGEMLSLNYNIIVDPSDIPARRYKMTFTIESGETRWAKFHCPLCIAYSADGIRWNQPNHVNPVLRGVSDDVWAFLYDPDRRKYLLFTRRVPNVPRDISLYESYDLVNWEDKGRVLVGGDELDPPEMYNLHALAPAFFYEEFCLGLLGTMCFLPGAESYTVFNRPPKDCPGKPPLGHLNVQLAYSRDGQNWTRPRDRSPIIPNGRPGSPDAGTIYPVRNGPVFINGDTWIYYGACAYNHTCWSQQSYLAEHGNDARQSHCCMLAIMPEDHWVSLDAGKAEGSFVCKPWGPPHEIFVNADAAEGAIEAELVTPYGKVVPDYSRGDCIAVAADGKNQAITWKHGRSPWNSIVKDHIGGLLVKFYLKNAKLYSYTFTLPDPDGQLERDRINARWCDSIKHRNGNWDRNSHEPAGGVPPYTGPEPKI